MKIKYSLYFIIISIMLLATVISIQTACNELILSSRLSYDEMKKIVSYYNSTFNKGINSKNPYFISDMYTDSALYILDNYKIRIGKTEIFEQWRKNIFEMGIQNKTLDPLKIAGNREIIYESGFGNSFIKKSDDVETEHILFKYVNVWILQPDGSYKLDIDCYNYQLPGR